MVTAPGSHRRHREIRRGGSPRGGSSRPAAAMGSPQRPPLAHVFKGTFVHSSASAPLEILPGHLLGVDDNGTVSAGLGRGAARAAGDARNRSRCSRDPRSAAAGGGGTDPCGPGGGEGQGQLRRRKVESVRTPVCRGRRRGKGSSHFAGAGGSRDGATPRYESAAGVNLVLRCAECHQNSRVPRPGFLSDSLFSFSFTC